MSDAQGNDGEAGGKFKGYAAERDIPGAEANADEKDPAPSVAFRDAAEHFSEIRDYVVYYLKTRVDAARVGFRNFLLMSALVIATLVTVGALVITAIVFLLMGIAQGLSELFGGRPWLGNLVTAVVMLGAIAGGTYYAVIVVTRTSKARIVASYDKRKSRQRQEHGVDVEQRAEQE